MARVHVLYAAEAAGEFRLVLHFPVPEGENEVGVSHRDALVFSGLAPSTVLRECDHPGCVSNAEEAQIDRAEIYEHVGNYEVTGSTPAQRTASLLATWESERARVLAELQQKLNYFGLEVGDS